MNSTTRTALLWAMIALVPLAGCNAPSRDLRAEGGVAADPREKRLANIRQLTFGGENAEAYFSSDGARLIFQSTRPPFEADQIYTMNVDGNGIKLISTGKGKTTCSYFFPDGRRIIYASTHLAGDAPPPKPDFSKGYVWALHPSYDIFSANRDGSDLKRLTTADGYDAEGTISADGKRIVFTSLRDGDLELYTMNADGSNQRRLTTTIGYDGGAFFSADGRTIVYRAYHPKTEGETREYRELLKEGLIRPMALQLHVMRSDGSGDRQITDNGAANFAPFFHPDGKRIVFSSNMADPKGRNFDLYLISADGTGLERVTFNETFDGFPMFSPDGKRIVFASNRLGKVKGETNIFIADWIDAP